MTGRAAAITANIVNSHNAKPILTVMAIIAWLGRTKITSTANIVIFQRMSGGTIGCGVGMTVKAGYRCTGVAAEQNYLGDIGKGRVNIVAAA